MNQLFLVGRLTKEPEIEYAGEQKKCTITVACKRPFKNSEGVYETDFISCNVWNVIAERVCEYCKKGDLISVKARLQNNNYTDKDNNKVYSYDVVADQVSFMQAEKKGQNEEKEPDDER